jgi:hypothetical protein
MLIRRLLLLVFCFFIALMGAAAGSQNDARAISKNILARHMPFGVIVDPVFVSPGSDQIVSYTHCGDSAIWTGHYLAAEAFRYRVNGEGMDGVQAALAGIASLVNVTGTGVLARCLVPVDSPYAHDVTVANAPHGVFLNAQSGYYWIGNTSRDQYSGVFFGLGVAYDLIQDAEVRTKITRLVTLLLDFLLGHNWSVIMPNGRISTTFIGRADQQLSLLQVGRHVNPGRYSNNYDLYRFFFATQTIVPISTEVLSDDSYSKFNLDTINLFNLIRLEQSSFESIYRGAYNVLRRHTDDHQNAFFNMIDRGLNGPMASRDLKTRDMLEKWLLRPRRDEPIDLRGLLPACGAEDRACEPIPIELRERTDFLWQRSPFQLVGQGAGQVENPGIDYILPYWMARYYGVVGD